MDGKAEKKNSKRFSSDNWDIINSLKQQKKELKEFEDQYEKSSIEISGNETDCSHVFNDCESLASCNQNSCLQLPIRQETTAASKYDPSLEAQCLKYPSSLVESGTECASDKPSQIDALRENSGTITESMKTLLQNLQRFESIKDEESLLNHRDWTITTEKSQIIGKEADNNNHPTSSQTNVAVSCLLSIQPLKKYFRGIVLSPLNDDRPMKPNSSLQYFMQVFKLHGKFESSLHKPELQSLINACRNPENDETCFEALKRILSDLHEEIIFAKKTGSVKQACLRRCRQSTRANHSIVSHIFRGHLKKRAECPCGHINIKHEPFTSLSLSFSNFDNKTIVMPVTTHNSGGVCVIKKYLLCFNHWTTIGNLKSKILHLNPQYKSKITIASVKDNDILHVHDRNSSVFDAICMDGELQAFETHRLENRSCEANDDTEYPYTSTPAVTDMSDVEEQGKANAVRKRADNNQSKNEAFAVPFVFKAHSYLTDHEICRPPSFVYLPKLIDGSKISRVCSRLLGITECEASRMFVSIKSIENEQCLLCSDINCSGCHLKASRTIALGAACKIIAYIMPSMQNKAPEYVEHSTLKSGIPANIFSIEEGITSFRKQDSAIVCSACGIKQQLEVTRSVISYPDVLVVKINSENKSNITLTYPHLGFAPDLTKVNRNRKIYDLSGVISSLEEPNRSSSTQYNFSNSPVSKKLNVKQAGNGESSLDKNIEILVYSKSQTMDKRRNRKASYHHTAKKMPRKKRGQLSSSSAAKEESREKVDMLSNLRGMKRQASAVSSCFTDGVVSQRTTRDDDTASVCNCTRCHCLQKCAEQIRGSASTTIENLKLDEVQLNKLKESVSASPNATAQLHRAILKQDLRRAVSLLKRGSNPNELVDGIAAIHLAAGLQLPMGYFFTKLLIDHGADPNTKTVDGVTPVQLASMWNRSETLRFLSYHGGDLSTTNDIIELPRKTNSTLSNVYSQTSCTPKESPAKANRAHSESESPHYSEADLRLKSIIYLQRSLKDSHLMLQEATGPADDFAHLKLRSIEAAKESITRGQQLQDIVAEHEDIIDYECGGFDSERTSELGTELALSDFSVGDMEDSVIPELDEVDFPEDLNISTVPQVPSSVNGNSVTSGLSDLEEENHITIEYAPESHINATRKRLPYYLCCGYRPRSKPRQKSSVGVFGDIRKYCRNKLERFRDFAETIRRENV